MLQLRYRTAKTIKFIESSNMASINGYWNGTHKHARALHQSFCKIIPRHLVSFHSIVAGEYCNSTVPTTTMIRTCIETIDCRCDCSDRMHVVRVRISYYELDPHENWITKESENQRPALSVCVWRVLTVQWY